MNTHALSQGFERNSSAHRRGTSMRCSRDAVAAMEFGLIAPVMIIMVFGVFELARAAIIWEQVWKASRSIAESATTLAIQQDSSAQLTGAQVNQALSTIFAEIPWLRGIIANGGTAAAVLTSVNYATGQAGVCSPTAYCATVQWSKPYNYTGFNQPVNGTTIGQLRPCGPLMPVKAGTAPANTTLPITEVNGDLAKLKVLVPDAFLIADVVVSYKLSVPNLFFFLPGGNVTFSASSYLPVRSNVPQATNTWAMLRHENDALNPNNGAATCCPAPCQ